MYGIFNLGFSSGYVYWDDEDLNNDNSRGGALPDGTYDKNTRIYYCCRFRLH
jgi:CUB/sushi domain-containing protein